MLEWWVADGWRVVVLAVIGVGAVVASCVAATYDMDRRHKAALRLQAERRRARGFAEPDAVTPRYPTVHELTTKSMPKPAKIVSWP